MSAPFKNTKLPEFLQKHNTNKMLHKTLTGKEFTEFIGDEPMIKFTTESEVHNGLVYKTGLNVDIRTFYNKSQCKQGGIYFTSLYYFHMWLCYGSKQCVQFRYVTIPEDAKVYIEEYKYKADKLILSEAHGFNELSELWTDPRYVTTTCLTGNLLSAASYQYIMSDNCFNMPPEYFRYVLQNFSGHNLVKFVPEKILDNKDFRMQLYNVKPSSYAKMPERFRSTEDAHYVLKQDPNVFRNFPETEKNKAPIYKVALFYDPLNISYIKPESQTPDICSFVFEKDKKTFKYLAHHTPDMFEPAITHDPMNLQYIKYNEQTEDLIMTAVQKNGIALQFADYQTYAIAYEAVKQTGKAYEFVATKRPLTIIKHPDGTITEDYDDSLMELALETEPSAIRHLTVFSEALLLKAINKNITSIKNIKPRWHTPTIKDTLCTKCPEYGFNTFPKHQLSEKVELDILKADEKNISIFKKGYNFSPTAAEYIITNLPNYKHLVINGMTEEQKRRFVQDDVVEALLSDELFDSIISSMS